MLSVDWKVETVWCAGRPECKLENVHCLGCSSC